MKIHQQLVHYGKYTSYPNIPLSSPSGPVYLFILVFFIKITRSTPTPIFEHNRTIFGHTVFSGKNCCLSKPYFVRPGVDLFILISFIKVARTQQVTVNVSHNPQTLAILYIAVCPYTKVEDSFNLQTIMIYFTMKLILASMIIAALLEWLLAHLSVLSVFPPTPPPSPC